MITLITGGPGTGKTAWLIDQLLTLRKSEPDREYFIHGIRNLRGLPHVQIYCKSQLCDICRGQEVPESALYVENWPQWKQQGSLIVVDEVQRIWRPRSSGSVMPDGVSGLETHRHYGLDFWIISQGPHLFDSNIRLLVGKHIHLLEAWNGRSQYEWPECNQNVKSRGDAVERPYKLPKRVFEMYDSAEVHTKNVKRKPMAFYALIVLCLLSVGITYFVVQRFRNRIPDTELVSKEGARAVPTARDPLQTSTKKSDKKLETAADYEKALTPVVSGLPWSAPYYAELAKPVSMPVVIGCVQSKKHDDNRCNCYTQQATVVQMPAGICEAYIKRLAFNPFRADYVAPGRTEGNLSSFQTASK